MIEITTGWRPPSVVKRCHRGTGMVTPTRPLTVTYNGRRERLKPGQSRLVPDHAIVRAQPTAFAACDRTDTATRDRLRSMQPSGTTTRPSRSGVLRPSREPWRVRPIGLSTAQPWRLQTTAAPSRVLP